MQEVANDVEAIATVADEASLPASSWIVLPWSLLMIGPLPSSTHALLITVSLLLCRLRPAIVLVAPACRSIDELLVIAAVLIASVPLPSLSTSGWRWSRS